MGAKAFCCLSKFSDFINSGILWKTVLVQSKNDFPSQNSILFHRRLRCWRICSQRLTSLASHFYPKTWVTLFALYVPSWLLQTSPWCSGEVHKKPQNKTKSDDLSKNFHFFLKDICSSFIAGFHSLLKLCDRTLVETQWWLSPFLC